MKFGSCGPRGLTREFRNLKRTEVRTSPNDLRTRVRLGAEGTGHHSPVVGTLSCPWGHTDGACHLCSPSEVCQRRLYPPVSLSQTVASSVAWPRALPRPPSCTHARCNTRPTNCAVWLCPGALFCPSLSQHVCPVTWQTVLSHKHQGDTQNSSQEACHQPKRQKCRSPTCCLTQIMKIQHLFTKELVFIIVNIKSSSHHKTCSCDRPG